MNKKRIISLAVAVCMSITGFAIPSVSYADDAVTTEIEEKHENLLPVEATDPESMQQYKDYVYYDPQWVTDEALFGVWDGDAWVPQEIENGTKSGGVTVVDGPLLKYDLEKYNNTMKPIEEAAKRGDYASCKELILEHFKQKYALLEPMRGSATRRNEISAQTLFYNLAGYSNGTDVPIELLEVGTNPGWYSVDITDSVKSVATSEELTKGLLLLMVALRRDGCRATFSSMEGENPAYVEVELSDGTKKRYDVQFDASMSAGSNSSRTYGSEPVFEVEESVSSISSETNVDNNTRRAYVRFDMDSLTPQDDVRSGTLYMYGSNNSTDSSYDKKIALYKIGYGRSHKESTFNWNSVEHYVMSDDKEYTFDHSDTRYVGENFVDTVYRGSARASGAIVDCINMFLATGNEEYSYHAIRTLLGLCMERGMLGNPKDTGTYWPYSTKLCLGNRGQIYQSRLQGLIDSKYMTPEVFTCLLKLAWTTGEQLEYCWQTQETTTNWGNTQATALFNMALYFDEFEDCHKPLSDYDYQQGSNGKSGGWNELGGYRLIFKSDEILFEDGSCPEIPMGYVDYSLSGLIGSYNRAVTANMEESLPSEVKVAIERLIEYIIFMSAPDGSGYSQGNGKEHSANTPYTRASWFRNKTDNELIKWYGSGRKSGEAPKETSRIYPIGLKYISRSGWGTNAVGSHFNADGACNVHGHADDLSFNVAAYGEHLLVDNGVFDYTDNSTRAWQISTRAHNTIEINDVSQKAPKWTLSSIHNDPFGKETIYLPDYDAGEPDENGHKMSAGYFMDTELNSGYDYVRAGTNNNIGRKIAASKLFWNDYKQERSIFFVRPNFYLVTDYIEPLTDTSEVNSYKQYWHTLPGVQIDIDENTGVAKTSGQNASVIIAPVSQKDPVTPTVEIGYYSNKEGSAIETQHAVYKKEVAGATTMNTVIYPVAPGADFDVTTENIEMNVPESTASAFKAVISNKKVSNTETVTKYEKHIDRNILKQQNFGIYSTDGYLAVIDEMNGTLTGAALQGGTNLKDGDGNNLIYSKELVPGLHTAWKKNSIELNTGKAVLYGNADVDTQSEIDLYKLTIYAPNQIDTVTLNGEQVPFKRSGNYIYFGNDAIIEDSNTPEKDDTPTGGSGGGGGGGGGGAIIESDHGAASTPKPTEEPTDEPTENPEMLIQEVEGHWAESEITMLIENGVVTGSEEGLRLSDTITRAEFATMLVRALGLEEVSYSGGFWDVDVYDWYADIIATCVENGIMEGSDGMMRPNDNITREEMAKMIVTAYNGKSDLEPQEKFLSFEDRASISSWAIPYVCLAVDMGFINGFENNTFRPDDNALREQAMAVIYRMMYNKQESEE